jgi:tetratricopeptide (TPR) repeat protein
MFILSIGFLARNRNESAPQLLTPKAQASLMSGLQETGALGQRSNPTDPAEMTEEERLHQQQATAEILLQQARLLREEGRAEESRIFIQRTLELSPDHEAATSELEQVDSEIAALKQQTQQERALRRLLANANALIRAGKLQQAQAEISRLRRAAPRMPEVLALRRRWQAANQEAEKAMARRRAQELKQTQRQEAESAYSNRVDELHRAGDYEEAEIVLGDWLTKNPESTAAQQLQQRNQEFTRHLATYRNALDTKKYDQALNALAQLEASNPEASNLPELRRRVNSYMANARATLSIYRLGESGELMMDGRSLSSAEILNQSIPIGEHVISIRNGSGREASRTQHFYENQSVFYVYDTDPPSIRLMSEGDRDLVNLRKVREEVHSYSVNHSHGLFRGGCRGELLVNYFEVAFRPTSGSHSFRVPFRTLDLEVKDNAIELIQADSGKSFIKFKSDESGTARALELIWNKLKGMKP